MHPVVLNPQPYRAPHPIFVGNEVPFDSSLALYPLEFHNSNHRLESFIAYSTDKSSVTFTYFAVICLPQKAPIETLYTQTIIDPSTQPDAENSDN